MKLTGYLEKDLIVQGLTPKGRSSLIAHLLKLVGEKYPVGDRKKILRDLMTREKQSTTGIGCGIAVPHTIVESLSKTILALASIPRGMDFHSVDNRPVNVVFLLLSPPGRVREHLKLLARISRICSSPMLVDQIVGAPTEDEVIELIKREDDRHVG